MSETFAKDSHILLNEGNMGEVRISDTAIAIIAGIAAMEIEGVSSMAGGITSELVSKLGVNSLSKGVKVDVEEDNVYAEVSLNVQYNYNIPEVCEKVQRKVKSSVENMTGLNVVEVKVRIAGVNVPE